MRELNRSEGVVNVSMANITRTITDDITPLDRCMRTEAQAR
jgi:hypothetical protein